MRLKIWGLPFFIIALALSAYGQMNPQGVAPGLLYDNNEKINERIFPLGVSTSQLIEEDEMGVWTGVPYRIGYAVPVYTDLFELGQWFEMEDGRKFFRAVLKSPGALAVNVSFDDFYIPQNAQLFFYDQARNSVYGGYTFEDNHESRMFPGPLVDNDVVIVEYFEPESDKVTEKPVLLVKDIMHYYRSVDETFKNQNIGSSGDCNVNINCPEGDLWQVQKRGVARILLRVGGSAGWCSGTLINNTAQDGTPYFLTAEHCGSGASAADHNLWQFRFNFERPECADSGVPATQTITGSQLMAIGLINGGSDMRLVKLNFTPPSSYAPYYNGWDRTAIPATSGVGIHHPAGDVKKISTFAATATNVQNPVIGGTSMATNSAWNVYFVATQTSHGVTEGGSSGSPLFNESGLLVGTLTGGSSSCTSPNGANVYGKMNFHWESNGDELQKQLRPWLDPLGTGQLTLSGLDIYPMPKIKEVSGTLNPDYSVTIKWNKPAYDIQDNWYSHVSTYSSVRHETPERASYFDFKEKLDLDTFYLRKISHFFWQHPSFPWGVNNKFRFKIYGEDGDTLLYESEILTALNFQTSNRAVVHELSEEIVMTTPFFIAVAPENSGQPSSLSLEVTDTIFSYFGSAGDWQPLMDEDKKYELLMNVYGSGLPLVEQEKQAATEDMLTLGPDIGKRMSAVNQLINPDLKLDKLISSIAYYKIYRDGVEAGTTIGAEELNFTDEGLEQERVYAYAVASVYNLNPSNPNSPFIESELSDAIEIKISFVNVDEVSQESFSIYPNPSYGAFTIKMPKGLTEANIKILDSHGALVQEQLLNGEGLAEFKVQSLKPGLYLVVFETRNEISTQKILIY